MGDCARAIFSILQKGEIGQIYNVSSGIEKKNIDVAREILHILRKPQRLIRFVKDRPGHDWRYAMDCSLIKKLGWQPQVDFATGIKETVFWYTNNRGWLVRKAANLSRGHSL